MKYLKIDNNRGFYIKVVDDQNIWIDIDKINKDDLLYLLNKAITEDFELDEFKEEILENKAHQIIYKSLFEKFSELLSNKTRFKDESESLYKEALDKYSINF